MSALDEAKAYLRLETAAEDGLVARLADAAIGLCEQFTGQVAIARTVSETLPITTGWQRLTAAPVRAITGVEAIGAGGAVTLPIDAYAIDIDRHGTGWVRVTVATGTARVRVTAQAGLAAEWDGLPAVLRQGVVRLIAHLFAHRDAPGEGAPPAAVAALWRPWRRMRLS